MSAAALALAGCFALMNDPPIASFVFETSAFMVTFDASQSRDSDGTIDKYVWDFDDDAVIAPAEDADPFDPFFGDDPVDDDTVDGGETASHLYSEEGTYAVSLIVTDDSGATDSTTRYVTIGVVPDADPIARFSFKNPVAKGDLVVFNGGRSHDPDGGNLTYGYWDFGDGTKVEGEWTNGYNPVVYVTHPYTQSGSYTVSLLVRDNEGALGRKERNITVGN